MKRLGFANQLRGIAALLVASSHLVGIYWGLPAFVAATVFAPIQSGPPPALAHMLYFTWFEAGPFGVALFFLISGLVIPFSLAKHTRRTFLGARILRIYPTLFASLLLEMLVLHASARYWHHPFGDSAMAILTNALLINDLTGYGVIDLVNWTLAIEVAFYVLVVLLAGPIRQARIAPLFAVAVLITAGNIVLRQHFHVHTFGTSPLAYSFSLESPYLIFMFVGLLFNFHHRGRLPVGRLIPSILVLTTLFLVSWRFSTSRPWFLAAGVNYLYAIVLFGALYAARHRIPESRILNAMAAISFPFYLIHALVGFSTIKFLMLAWHLNYYVALPIAVAIILALATLLHVTVERATIAWGHRLTPRRRQPGSTAFTTTSGSVPMRATRASDQSVRIGGDKSVSS